MDLPGPITFDRPTPAALADYIAVRHMLPLAVTAHPWPGDSSVIAPPSCAPSHTKLTEIVGWSAAVAGNGQPDTSECQTISTWSNASWDTATICQSQFMDGCSVSQSLSYSSLAAMADRIYDAAECVTPVPLERWDLETPRTDEEGPQVTPNCVF